MTPAKRVLGPSITTTGPFAVVIVTRLPATTAIVPRTCMVGADAALAAIGSASAAAIAAVENTIVFMKR
jgi:hypothetical protein